MQYNNTSIQSSNNHSSANQQTFFFAHFFLPLQILSQYLAIIEYKYKYIHEKVIGVRQPQSIVYTQNKRKNEWKANTYVGERRLRVTAEN